MTRIGSHLRHSRVPALGLAIALAWACASTTSQVPNVFDVQHQVDQYIEGGQYEADFAKVVAGARAYLDERAKMATRPAIVLDIDETALSNWPAYKANGWVRIVNGDCNLPAGPCGLRTWQERAQLKALSPTLDLARQAKFLGVAVFFITGRPAHLRDATERNLREAGYQWDGLALLPGEVSPAHVAADFKAPERKKIADQGYTILLSMGDQESDLVGGFAERTFKLPNPVYFIP